MTTYDIRQITDFDEWTDLFARVDRPPLVQSWAYGEAKRATGWRVRRLVIDRDGAPAALCLVLDKRPGGLPIASRINRGPMLLDPDDPDVEGLYRALRRKWRFLTGGVLLIGPALADSDDNMALSRAAGFRVARRPGWGSAYLDLRSTEAELRKRLSSRWRNHLNVSERQGLTLRISGESEDAAWLVDRHVENMRDKGFDKPTAAFVRALRDAAGEDFLVFQIRLGDTPVGGSAIVRFGHTAEYYVAWYGPEGRKVNAGNFLLWHAAMEMKRRGCRYFDLGGFSAGTKYGDFKRPMNGVDYLLLGECVSVW